MRWPAFIARWLERDRARPRTKVELWIEKQRQYVLRLPRWLIGTWTVSSFALGIWCVVYDKGLMGPLRRLYDRRPEYAVMGTIALTVLACLIALYGVARIIRPPAPTNLPSARVRE